ncbi:MAG: hydrogenase iron-sulfur subunit [Bacteroidales bacterium]
MPKNATIGLALCSGCGLGTCLDLEALKASVGQKYPEVRLMEHPALCSEEGLQLLHGRMEKDRIDRLAIAACSPRQKTEVFDLDGTAVERVNLREQICWMMPAGDEDTQLCAADQVHMALAKLAAIRDNKPYLPESVSTDILVVGGGMAGLTAALQGAGAGYRVHLAERSIRLGGYASRIRKAVPEPWKDTAWSDPKIDSLVRQARAHPLIEIHLATTVDSIQGEPGNFSVVLKQPGDLAVRVGAVVNTTGWKPYPAAKLQHLGYGLSDRIKTLEEFEQFVGESPVPDRVCIQLCAGSRDKNHLAYCSVYCCTAALKQALYIREKNPAARVYILYKDIRTPGLQEELYKRVQADDMIFLTKGRADNIRMDGQTVALDVKDSLLGENVELRADLLILANGMVPGGADALRLAYRQGPELPRLAYEFADSHFICFPYETRRTGIYAAGAVRAPMDLESAREDGGGAMMKAIQCVESVKRGEAVHPRAGDATYPELYMERCTDCKRCTEECPFGSYDETEKGTPLPNPARCRRCGICVGSCPERVIGFSDFNINSVSAMIKAVSVPDEFEEKPRVLVFLCENDAYPALDGAGIARLQMSPFVRIVPVRCLGSINKVWISDALSHGYDGILQIGCKPGDDYQCHFITGSELTRQRGENFQEALESMMLEPERIETRFVEITDQREIVKMINDYVETLVEIGPNPYKE